jgi:hypothetical protein
VQEALRQLGYDSGPSDGAVGPLPETGQITPDLIQELSAAFYERT